MISSALWLDALDHGVGVTRAMSWNRFRTILKSNSSVFVRKGTHAQKLNSSVLKQNARADAHTHAKGRRRTPSPPPPSPPPSCPPLPRREHTINAMLNPITVPLIECEPCGPMNTHVGSVDLLFCVEVCGEEDPNQRYRNSYIYIYYNIIICHMVAARHGTARQQPAS